MLVSDDPHLISLLVADKNAESPDYELAALHLPILSFDSREPFLPLAVGYSIFRQAGASPSFPRTLETDPDEIAIEYAIWWDWDIGHLYELEHVWVYLDSAGNPSRAEASWHGRYHSIGSDGSLQLEDGRLALLSEPGKHAFAPLSNWFKVREQKNVWSCCEGAGNRGLLAADVFGGELPAKSASVDQLIQMYLRGFAFVPTYSFDRKFPLQAQSLIPWPRLREWIPERIERTIQRLEKLELAEPETLKCERAV